MLNNCRLGPMSRAIILLLLITAIIAPLAAPLTSRAVDQNLIPNSSVELVSPSSSSNPASWQTGYIWGNLQATYSYPSVGYNSSRSLRVDVNQYTNGDAKWYFTPVAIVPLTNYSFSDYYQSNVTTSVVAEFTSNLGVTSYTELGVVGSSNTWQQTSLVVRPPAGTVTLTIFHLISQIGYLQTDNFSLTAAQQPTGDSLIPNPSFEIASPTAPAYPYNWYPSQWGQSRARFQYLNSGRTGSRSVSITMSNYVQGDAKWYYSPVNVSPNQAYQFADYYKATVPTRVVAWVVNQDGSDTYMGLRMASVTSSWARYSDSFITPASAVKVSIFHLIQSNGSLTLDDYSLAPMRPTGFSKGIVSLTFDDGNAINSQTVLPTLKKYGLVSTNYDVSGFIGAPDYQTADEIKAFTAAGNEVGSHSVSHSDLTSLTSTQLNNELSQSQKQLQSLLSSSVSNFAAPYGTYNDTVLASAKKYYRSFRTVDDGYNYIENFDPYRLKVQNVTQNTTPADISRWVQIATNNQYWLIIVYHQVVTDSTTIGSYDTTLTNFQQEMVELKSSGVSTLTVNQALNLLANN